MEGYNVSIIGKSGVGKSALLNYLFGEEVAKTGSGAPQTTEGFHLKAGKISGKKVNIYDSWGLEPGESDRWLKKFKEFQKKKQQETNIKKWLHTVIYCISAEGKRIENFEIEILNEIKKESLNPVIVITKADSKGTEEFVNQVKKILGAEPILISSVKKEKGFGKLIRVTEPFGKVDLIKKIKESASDSLNSRIRFLLHQRINVGAEELRNELLSTLKVNLDDHSFLGYISKKDLDEIEQSLKKIVKGRSAQISKEVAMVAENAKIFYEGDLSDLLNTSLEETVDYHINEVKPEEDRFSHFSSLSTALAVTTIIPTLTLSVFAIPIAVVGGGILGPIIEKLTPNLMDGIPTYSKEKVLEAFCAKLRSSLVQSQPGILI
jgi:small GTP-binding protein